MFCVLIVLLILVSLALVPVYFRYCRAGQLLRKLPGSNGSFFFGNTFDITLSPEKLFQYIRKTNKEYGVISKFAGFHIRAINVWDPDDIETILSTTRYNEKQRPYYFLKPWLNEGLLISNGNKWQQRRKLLTPAFHFNILKKFLVSINEHTEELMDRIREEVGKEKTDITPIMLMTTLRVMCETSMGTSMEENTHTLSDKYFQALHRLGPTMVHRMTRVWLYLDWLFNLTPTWREQKAAISDLHGFTKQVIRERKILRQQRNSTTGDVKNELNQNTRRGRLAMLDLLLEHEANGKIEEDGIREEVDTFMFEGHDTTAMALIFIIMAIANEPEIQEKINEEMLGIFGYSDRSPTPDDLAAMKYLECCIKESLRIYPSVPFMARYLTEEVTLSGYRVPANTICQIHVFDLHRNAELFPDPERFIPERFTTENANRRHPFAYIPFSAGPRNCIGQKFAMLELKTVLSGLVRRFRVHAITKPADLNYTADIVLRVTHPIYVRFSVRERDRSDLHDACVK